MGVPVWVINNEYFAMFSQICVGFALIMFMLFMMSRGYNIFVSFIVLLGVYFYF